MSRPQLTVKSSTVSSNQILAIHTYVDEQGDEFLIYVENTIGSLFDSVKMVTPDELVVLRDNLEKGQKYCFANHSGRCYVANGADRIWWFDSTFSSTGTTYDPSVHTMANSPIAQYLITSKTRLFAADVETYLINSGSYLSANQDLGNGIRSFVFTANQSYFRNDVAPGDYIALTFGSTATISVLKGTKTITIASDLTDKVAANDFISLSTTDYFGWYEIHSMSVLNAVTTITLETTFKESDISAVSMGFLIMGGNASGEAGKYTSAWQKIESITDEYTLNVRTAITTSGTSQKYIIRRRNKSQLLWSAYNCSNDWTVEGVEGRDPYGDEPIPGIITGLHDFAEATLIFTTNSVYAIIGTTPGEWRMIRKTKSEVGCDSHWSISSKDNYIAWWSNTNGIYYMQGSQIANGSEFFNLSSLESENVSNIIKNYIKNIDTINSKSIISFIDKDLLLFSVPNPKNTLEDYLDHTATFTSGSTLVTGTGTAWLGNISVGDIIFPNSNTTQYRVESVTSNTELYLTSAFVGTTSTSAESYVVKKLRNNDLLILDTRTSYGEQTIGWTVENPVNVASATRFNNRTIYASSNNGNLYEFNTGTLLNGNPITMEFKTGEFHSSLPGTEKIYDGLNITCKGKGNMSLSWVIDGVINPDLTVFYPVSWNDYRTVKFPNYTIEEEEFGGRGSRIYLVGTITDCDGFSISSIQGYGILMNKDNI